MNDYTALIEAIDRLTAAVNQTTAYSVVSECISVALATIGGVITVLIVDVIKELFFAPNKEFQRLRRKVNGRLSMYACYYTNQIDLARSDKKQVELYSSASNSIREVAVDLMEFVDEAKRKKYCGIPVSDISEAVSLLFGLSNSFFTPYNCPEMVENRDNDRVRKEIRKLLGIDHC